MRFVLFSVCIFLFSISGNGQFKEEVGYRSQQCNIWSITHQPSMLAKPTIDFDAIYNWVSVTDDPGYDVAISPNGKYFVYGYGNFHSGRARVDTLIIASTVDTWQASFAKAKPGFFSKDSKLYIFQDKDNSLCFLTLDNNQQITISNVSSYQTPDKGDNIWVAYQLKDAENTVVLQNILTGKKEQFKNVVSYSFDPSRNWLICQLSNPSQGIAIYNLEKGAIGKYPSATSCIFSRDGKIFLLQMGVELVYNNTLAGTVHSIRACDPGHKIETYTLDENGIQLTWVTIDSSKKNKAGLNGMRSIWYWREGIDKPVQRANDQMATVGSNEIIGDGLSFTKDGNCIQFYLNRVLTSGEKLIEANANVNIWSYKDTVIQSAQLQEVNETINYKVLVNAANGKIVWRDDDLEKLQSCIWGYGLIGSKRTSFPYNRPLKYGDRFWEKGYKKDSIWLVSLETGKKSQLASGVAWYDVYKSPGGKYVLYFNRDKWHYYSFNTYTGEQSDISEGIPYGWLGIYSNPDLFTSFEKIRWLTNDSSVLVYDEYDIWQLDPSGKKRPVNITNGYGRSCNIKFSWMDNLSVDKFGSTFFLEKDTLLLGAFDPQTKLNGFYRQRLGSVGNPDKIYMGSYIINETCRMKSLTGRMLPLKASNSRTWVVQRESATEAPNYFVTHDFKTYRALSNLQPHKGYNWLTTELHNFKQIDGSMSQGILYKPENFDPQKKYPVIISFYGPLSDRRYQYINASYITASEIFQDPTWLVSHGYLVFLPDIIFNDKGWGVSALNTIDGAAKYLSTLSYVSAAHMGTCGHSNSGRTGYYLISHSHRFAAMCAGSGTANIISNSLSLGDNWLEWGEKSSYGGGLGNLWQNKQKWLDHTTVLNADKVSSPVLMFAAISDLHSLSNEGGQAFGMYTALRRLEKKAWWAHYPNGAHRVAGIDAQDWTIRFTQFFDHYLKGAPAPSWMTQGIPAKIKRIESRYELDPTGTCAMQGKTTCAVCRAWNAQYKRTPEVFTKPIADWKLDDDLEKQLEKEETERHNKNMKGEAERIRVNNLKLRGIYK